MSPRWTLDSIPWDKFQPDKVTPDLLAIVKAASLVEANAADYVTYLNRVFVDDADFRAAAEVWGREEEQHGAALGRWAEMADPQFSFERSLALFRDGYRIPLDAEQSVRGSRAGELIARCVVETGTSSFYSAIRDATEEPVLKEICRRIASDEFFHYRLFHKHFKRYQASERLGPLARLKVAFGRAEEAEDDELAYAYFAANVLPKDPQTPYDRETCAHAYWRRAMSLYRRHHVDTAARMILRAAAVNPDGRIADLVSRAGWRYVAWRRERLARAA
ncbi:MAG: ferritin-like domain-containing protein [Alphaproteobacteria bacterium]|nr:MAG: ferritin-like domain-containing protein [Alphaproteobacteria bacterium]